uniref:Uncharacterized protein n=1 Tax=Populus trichocarpa TaxID=3694 RepID=A0A2K2C4Z7_POPTR
MEEQLYHTIASTLKPLHIEASANETTEDLRRLCVIFEHVEKLLTLAVSLHRKFMQAPCLSEAIFTDYHNFYLPRMGTGSTGLLDVDEKRFSSRTRDISDVYMWNLDDLHVALSVTSCD